MRKKRNILALTLVFVLAVSLSACGQNKTPAEQDSNPAEKLEQFPAAPDAGDGDLDKVILNLPEQYAVTYQVAENAAGLARSYSQSIVQTGKGIYLELGDRAIGERFVFENLGNGKYLLYQYNPISGKYAPPMLTSEVQTQIDSGNMTLDMVTLGTAAVVGLGAIAAKVISWRARRNAGNSEQELYCDCDCECE